MERGRPSGLVGLQYFYNKVLATSAGEGGGPAAVPRTAVPLTPESASSSPEDDEEEESEDDTNP